MITVFQNLLNSGSKAMNVNGSVTPQTFSFTASQSTGVLGLMCILRDEGTTSLNKFGAITGLSNGLLIQSTLNSNTTTMATIKDNAELCTRFHFNQFGSGAILSLLGIATAEGFGNSNNIFIGFMEFNSPNVITMATSDVMQVVIQDDLRNIDVLEMAVKTCVDQ